MTIIILLFGALYLVSVGASIVAVCRAARLGDEAMEAALRDRSQERVPSSKFQVPSRAPNNLERGTRNAELTWRPERGIWKPELSTLNPQLSTKR